MRDERKFVVEVLINNDLIRTKSKANRINPKSQKKIDIKELYRPTKNKLQPAKRACAKHMLKNVLTVNFKNQINKSI